MSAQIARAAAPATSNAVTSGLACWMIANTLAAPVNDWAPNCRVNEPSCNAMTAPNGMDTSAVGRIVTLAMNQDCWMNSLVWKGRLKTLTPTSSPRPNSRPVSRRAPAPGKVAKRTTAHAISSPALVGRIRAAPVGSLASSLTGRRPCSPVLPAGLRHARHLMRG